MVRCQLRSSFVKARLLCDQIRSPASNRSRDLRTRLKKPGFFSSVIPTPFAKTQPERIVVNDGKPSAWVCLKNSSHEKSGGPSLRKALGTGPLNSSGAAPVGHLSPRGMHRKCPTGAMHRTVKSGPVMRFVPIHTDGDPPSRLQGSPTGCFPREELYSCIRFLFSTSRGVPPRGTDLGRPIAKARSISLPRARRARLGSLVRYLNENKRLGADCLACCIRSARICSHGPLRSRFC